MKIELGAPNAKQEAFFRARSRYIAYGGARGGGKSWALRKKALLLGLYYPGIRMLLVRKTFPQLRENHLAALRADLEATGLAVFREREYAFTFVNGSRLKLGYCDTEADAQQYQGQEYDILLLDEATQLTQEQFASLKSCVRGVNGFPKRVYLTCNPGGVGHGWVKRLFVDRQYLPDEHSEDYTFIRAYASDNAALMASDPGYVAQLRALPENLRRAWLDGDWNVFAGQFFSEFRERIHVVEPFAIPKHWRIYRTLDYGLDMLAFYWVAVDEKMRPYVFRELYESELTVHDAARAILRASAGEPEAYATLAPPDLWNRRNDTGKSVADIFASYGIPLVQTGGRRMAGWTAMKEWLRPFRDETGREIAALRLFSTCGNLIRCLPQLTFDASGSGDASHTPHEITHGPDALRGFCAYWTAPQRQREERDAALDTFITYGN